jgi:hypothetical protein
MTDTLNGRCRQIRTLTGKIQTHPQTLWKRFCPIFSYFWAEIFCWVKFYVEKKLATYFVPYTYVAYVIECRFSSSNWKVQSSCSILVSYSPISKIIDNKQLIISKIVCFAEGAICSEPTRALETLVIFFALTLLRFQFPLQRSDMGSNFFFNW